MQAGTTDTALDRYYALFDRAVADPEAIDEFLALFAPEAVVRIDVDPLQGRDAIAASYRGAFSTFAEGKSFWNTTTLDDGRIKGKFVFIARMIDGTLVSSSGIEHATVDSDGLIVALYNEYIRPPA